MVENADYEAAWADMRRRRLILLAVFAGYLPGVVLLSLIATAVLNAFGAALGENLFFVIGISWMGAFLAVGIWYSWFRCPRCNNQFFMTWWCGNPLARKCLHCGLPRGAPSPTSTR
ncbi:hypothetical protein Plav_2157 [Parvibaculum lavamentivorans DS-1]|uniref:Uncharacterized protein n=1 Tax=Parvibaculum lavamentivorans (strain DS-1 / DSM 13023 / NCIMB 13966) TaxID=402881 RepID=A7HV38_PARL1|nr:hypothetical protein [Parvibaculum lavamentivorans]ABS63771.1 hypothetical protein Plav_2157 [Parvibaculum lavamentivorans DS-1]